MPDLDNLPPPAREAVSRQWDDFLRMQTPMTQDMLTYRYGYLMRPNMATLYAYPVELPHTSHRHYSVIASARMEKERVERIKPVRPLRICSQCNRWIPPDRYLPFHNAIPDISRFPAVMRLRFPNMFK